MKDELSKLQDKVNKMFEENNFKLNDEILQLQVEINEKRNELNIPDESEMIYKEFVQ